jgi:membrane-associated phospholipid phosphatase
MTAPSALQPSSTRRPSILAQLAVHEGLLAAYLLTFLVALLWSPTAPARTAGLQQVGLFLVFLVPGVLYARSPWGRGRRPAAVIYVATTYCTIQLSYFFLGTVLPQISPGNLDRALLHFDLKWFGVEPSVAMAPLGSTQLAEWFAFFYFCYFVILALHAVSILFGTRDDRLRGEYLLGMTLVFCSGQLLYAVVPGFGPYKELSGQFSTHFPSSPWVQLVLKAVATGGAQKDIFPSIHTAAPTFLTLLSFRHRHRLPFGHSWWLVWLFSANIVVATLFLRWHWVIDVSCGLLLALTAYVLSLRVTDWELKRRQRDALTPLVPGP